MFLEYIVIAGLVLFCATAVCLVVNRPSLIFYGLIAGTTSLVLLLLGFSLYWRNAAGLAAVPVVIVMMSAHYYVLRGMRK